MESGTFSAAIALLYEECTALIAAGKTPKAQALLVQDHGPMPTYLIDEMALRVAQECWVRGDAAGFFSWAALVSKAEVLRTTVGNRIRECLDGQDMCTAEKLCDLLPPEHRAPFQRAVAHGRKLLDIKHAYSATCDIHHVIETARGVPEHMQCVVLLIYFYYLFIARCPFD